jgi:hypothetical protein
MVDEVVGQDPKAMNAAQDRKAKLEAQRNQVLTQYPLLSRINPAEFNQLSEAQQTAKLREACGGVLNHERRIGHSARTSGMGRPKGEVGQDLGCRV